MLSQPLPIVIWLQPDSFCFWYSPADTSVLMMRHAAEGATKKPMTQMDERARCGTVACLPQVTQQGQSRVLPLAVSSCRDGAASVSYTHLTLPTNLRV